MSNATVSAQVYIFRNAGTISAVSTGTMIIYGDGTDLYAKDAANPANIYNLTHPSASNLSVALGNLTDVTVQNLTPDSNNLIHVLRYDAGTSQWVNDNLEISIKQLTNVSNTDPTSGQVLQWNGTAWAPTTLALYTDSDVDTHLNTSSASANEVLSWNGSDYDWVAQSGGGSASAAGSQYQIQIADASSGFAAAPWSIDGSGHLSPAATDATDNFGLATNPVGKGYFGQSGISLIKDDSLGTKADSSYATISTDGTNGDLIFKSIGHNNYSHYEFKASNDLPAKLILESGNGTNNFTLHVHPSSGNQVFQLPPGIGRNHTALLTTSVSGTDGELDWKCVTNTFESTYGYITFPGAPSGSLSGTGGQPQAHVVASASRFSLPAGAYIYSVVDNTDGNDHCKVTFNFDFNFRAFDGDYSISGSDAPNGSNYTIKVHFVAASDAANIETLGYAAASLPTGSTSIASFSFNPSGNMHRCHGQVSFSANNTRMTYLSSEVRHGSSGTVINPEAASPLTVAKFGNADADTLRDIAVIWEIGTTEASPALTAFTTGADFILVERSGGFS